MILEKIKQYKTLSYFITSSVSTSIVGLLSGFVSYRYIDPRLLGIWVTVTVFEVYATITRMGIPNGMCRELPFELGKGNISKAKDLASTTFAYSIFSGLFALLIIPLVLLTSSIDLSNINYTLCIGIVLFRVIFEPYTSYLSGTFRTNNQFDQLSKIQFIQAGIRLASIALVYIWGFYGLLIREIITPVTNAIQLHYARPFHIKPRFQWSIFKRLFKIGFPIFMISYMTLSIDTFPRLFLVKYGEAIQLGLFSPVIILIGTVVIIPNAIGGYLYPKLSFSWGQDADLIQLWKKTKWIYISSMIISIPISCLVILFLDYFIQLFPKYVDSVPYIKIACISILFIAFQLGNVLLVVLKKWIFLFLYTAIYAIVQVLSLFILKIYFTDVLFIATVSQLLTFSIMYVISFVFTYSATHNALLERVPLKQFISNATDNLF
jgi:O-antigen/teichoic acid export membrane protein